MIPKNFITVPLFFIAFLAFSQDNFIYKYGSTGFEQGAKVVATDDGYLLCGYSGSFDSSGASIYLLKVDLSGAVVFSRVYGGDFYDIPTGLVRTSDSGFAVCGMTWSFGLADANIFLLKTDSLGNLIWMKTFGTNKREKPFSLISTADSGFAITGFMQHDVSADTDNKIFLIKADSAGNMEWSKIYGGAGYEEASGSAQTFDKGYLIAGLTTSYSSGGNDLYLIKTDSTGTPEWGKAYGTSLNEAGIDVIQTRDSSYFLLGSSEHCGFGNSDMLLLKINASGDTVWTRCFGTSQFEAGVQLVQDFNDDLKLLGLSMDASYADILLSTVTTQGDLMTTIKLGGNGAESPAGFALTPDSGFVITGHASTDADPTDDQLVAKLNSDDNASCLSAEYSMSATATVLNVTDGVQLFTEVFVQQSHSPEEFTANTVTQDVCAINTVFPVHRNLAEVYPNPSADFILFRRTSNPEMLLKLEVYDVMGRVVFEKEFSGKEFKINGYDLLNGIYCYHLVGNEMILQRGFIVKL